MESTHVLESGGGTRNIAPGQVRQIGPFTVPNAALVTYVIADMPSGVAADSINAGISPDAMATLPNPSVFGEAAGVSSTTQTTVPLEAGAYDLLVECANLGVDCNFTDEISAFY